MEDLTYAVMQAQWTIFHMQLIIGILVLLSYFVIIDGFFCNDFLLLHSSDHLTLRRSKGQMQALFLRHEGFLGALGAFMDYENIDTYDLPLEDTKEKVS